MVKTLLYTSNPDFIPSNFTQVENFADDSGKFYTCIADENSEKGKLQPGAHILTSKGNNVYILEVSEGNTEYEFAKKCNITGIVKVDYPFETKQKTMTKNSIKGFSTRLKEMFMPVEAEGVRIATDGNICVETAQGYVSIDKNNNLTSYPEELTLSLPVYVISKPKEQLQAGDVIALDKSYAKVVSIKDGKISAIGYTEAGKTIHTIKDVLFNQTMVRVVVSLAGNLGGQMNPLMMLALSKDSGSDSLLPLMMMNQNGGALGMNPMLLMMLSDKGSKLDTKDILMMSALSGNSNVFGNLFGNQPSKEVASEVTPDSAE